MQGLGQIKETAENMKALHMDTLLELFKHFTLK